MEPTPNDPAEGKKEQTWFEVLLALYPRDLAREMVKTFFYAVPIDDKVMMPDMSAEELEVELAKSFDDVDADAKDANVKKLAEIEQIKQLFRDVRGKRLSEISPPTPEEDAAYIEAEVETAIAEVLKSWINMLYAARKHAGGDDVRLTELLDHPTPIPRRFSRLTWQEEPCNSIALTPEQVGKLHEAFVAKLRPLIDAAPEGYVLLSEKLVIKKDAQGYCLLALPAPQP